MGRAWLLASTFSGVEHSPLLLCGGEMVCSRRNAPYRPLRMYKPRTWHGAARAPLRIYMPSYGATRSHHGCKLRQQRRSTGAERSGGHAPPSLSACGSAAVRADAFMCVSGCPTPEAAAAAAARMAGMARDMVESVRTWRSSTGHSLRIRVGVHSGPAVAGVVGDRMPRWVAATPVGRGCPRAPSASSSYVGQLVARAGPPQASSSLLQHVRPWQQRHTLAAAERCPPLQTTSSCKPVGWGTYSERSARQVHELPARPAG